MLTEKQARNAVIGTGFVVSGLMIFSGAVAYAFNDAAANQCRQKIEQKQGCTAYEVGRYALETSMKENLFQGLSFLGVTAGLACFAGKKAP